MGVPIGPVQLQLVVSFMTERAFPYAYHTIQGSLRTRIGERLAREGYQKDVIRDYVARLTSRPVGEIWHDLAFDSTGFRRETDIAYVFATTFSEWLDLDGASNGASIHPFVDPLPLPPRS